jgi:hypothetical protein
MPTDILRPFPNAPDVPVSTPEQQAQMRLYAEQLLNPQNRLQPLQAAGTAYFSPFMGAANIVQQLLGRQQANRATGLQQAGVGQATQQQAPVINQLLGGQGQAAPTPVPGQSALAPNQPGTNQPRGRPNNNPGNIEDGPFAKSMPGYVGSDGRFAIFNSPQAGLQAMDSLLASYGKKGLNTPLAIASRWAPASEASNNPMAYASTVSKQMGISPNTPLNMDDPGVRSQLAAGMGLVENGRPITGMIGQQPQRMAQASPVDANNYAAILNNPNVPEATKQYYRSLIEPKISTERDVYGRPTTETAIGGIQQTPTQPGVTRGFRAPATVGAEGSVSTTIPQPAPGEGGAPQGQAQGIQGGFQQLYNAGRNIAAQGARDKATREQINQDQITAFNNIPIQQTLSAMKDDIQSHGDKMVWGPTADWVTNLKRSIAQHAPGMMSQNDLEGIASADSFEKLSAQLQTLVGRQVGSTDASLFQGMKSVPGSHNSKAGALALIDMLTQITKLNGQFTTMAQANIGQPGFDYMAEKNRFFEDHPIINPLTNNPIRMDLSGKGNVPSETRTLNGKTYFKINGTWHEGM